MNETMCLQGIASNASSLLESIAQREAEVALAKDVLSRAAINAKTKKPRNRAAFKGGGPSRTRTYDQGIMSCWATCYA